MPDTLYDAAEVYLRPGELCFARKPTVIRTVLGSCVGATFWVARLGIGALFHAQFPKVPSASTSKLGPHYVDSSIREIVRQLERSNVQRSEVEVKVFGGADVLFSVADNDRRPSIGKLNCDAALEVLNEEGFLVAASSLRGTVGRKIRFHTGTGEVLVRRLT